MAIISSFTRTDRFLEIEDCPLREIGSRPQAACRSCRFNVAVPGEGRVGCVVNTGFAAYEHALARLACVAAADHRSLLDILERERTVRPDEGLGDTEVRELLRIGAAWIKRLSGDDDEAAVAHTLHDFSRAALELREPVRILA